MKHRHLSFASAFAVILQNERAQAAEMVLEAGETTGGPENRHQSSDQWLFVADGEGMAIVEGREQSIRTGDLLLIERGETHEIRNTAGVPLKTLNLYVPPEY